MFDARARELQQQAVEALSDLRAWIWQRHAALLPDDLAAITRAEAERYAAVLDWYSRIEESLLALAAAGARPAAAPAAVAPTAIIERPVPPQAARHEQLTAPTVRAPTSFGGAAPSEGWQPMISVLAPVEPQLAAQSFKAA
ncbi:MAG: hypothetical protein RL685_3433 [Pseudomonadota bacterium]|jgi:hypothetical protein